MPHDPKHPFDIPAMPPTEDEHRQRYETRWGGNRGPGKSHDIAQQVRVRNLLRDCAANFKASAFDNVIVARAIDVARANNLRDEDAYLLAVIGLIEQNRELMNVARITFDEAPFVTSPNPKEKL